MIKEITKVVYIADIDQDIDDIVAIEFLHSKGALESVVLDPMPKSELGKNRVVEIEDMGVRIDREIPKGTDYVFNGGAFTKLANYLIRYRVKTIVANGGFVGESMTLEKDVIDKFKGVKQLRTYNPNIDVDSTIKVVNSQNWDELVLIGKNICHNEKNTTAGIWKNQSWLDKYRLKVSKRLHDVLMVQEGLKIITGNIEESILEYANGTPEVKVNKGRNSEWATKPGGKALVAVGWK